MQRSQKTSSSIMQHASIKRFPLYKDLQLYNSPINRNLPPLLQIFIGFGEVATSKKSIMGRERRRVRCREHSMMRGSNKLAHFSFADFPHRIKTIGSFLSANLATTASVNCTHPFPYVTRFIGPHSQRRISKRTPCLAQLLRHPVWAPRREFQDPAAIPYKYSLMTEAFEHPPER